MTPTQTQFSEAEHILSHPWDYSYSLFALALRFRRQWGVKV